MNADVRPSALRAVALVGLLILSIVPVTPVAAGGGDGVLSTFDTGLSTSLIDLDAGVMNSSVGVSVPREVTFSDFTFAVEVDDADESPGQVWLDINEDGTYEWAFLGQGYGNLGHQDTFAHGATVDSIVYNRSNGTTLSSHVLLPEGATLTSASLNVTFTPAVTTDFILTGGFEEMRAGDVDGDGGDEVVVLARSNNPNVNNTSFAVIDYNLTTRSLTLSSWVQTCGNATDFSLGDFNNDSRDDVFTWNPSDTAVCMHLSNASALNVTDVGGNQSDNSTGNTTSNSTNTTSMLDPNMPHIRWNPVLNLSVDGGLRGAWAADLTGDGIDDVVTYHGGGGGFGGGTNYNGIVGLYPFSPLGTGFLTKATVTLYRGQNRASLQDMWVGVVDNQTNTSTIVVVSSGGSGGNTWRGHTVAWDGRNLAANPTTFNDVRSGFLATDLNGDGGIDFVSGGGGFTHVVALRNATSWESQSYTAFEPFSTINATFGDHDGDGVPSLFMPNAGSGDGNAATLEGNISMRHSNGTGLDLVSPFLLEPWSVPRDILFADIDGDGTMEHVVAAGESGAGVFVGGWHRISLDVEGDGTEELSASGYAGTETSSVHGPLVAQDMFGAVKNALSGVLAAQTGAVDGYGVSMVSTAFTLNSTGSGLLNTTLIDVAYDARFIVEQNPSEIGNLSNLMNQRMETGSGSFRIALPFNSTTSGVLRITDLLAPYTDGAPQIVRPPAPELQLESLSSQMVTIRWQNMSDFGIGLLGFDVYRVPNGTDFDLSQPYADVGNNMTIDIEVEFGAIYDYAVRSRQIYGVRSNLSDVLTVEIPYPDPPPAVLNLTATDVPGDEGGHLRVTWDVEADSSAVVHHVFVGTDADADPHPLPPVVSVVSGDASDVVVNISAPSMPLVDGTPYYVWVAGEDEYGNLTVVPARAGPVAPRNDQVQDVQVSLVLLGSMTSDSTSLLPLNGPVQATVEALVNGQPLEGVDAWLHLQHAGSGLDLLLEGSTNAQGRFYAINEASLMAWDPTFALSIGPISVTFGVEALLDDPMRQPTNASSDALVTNGMVQVQIDGPTIVEVASSGQWTASFTVSEVMAEQDGAAPYVDLAYTLYDADGATLDSGALTMNGGTYTYESSSTEAARLEVRPENSDVPWVVSNPAVHVVTIEREGSGGTGGTGGSGGTGGTGGSGGGNNGGLFDLVVSSCSSITVSRDISEGDQVSTTPRCDFQNPNMFDVTIEVQASTASEGTLRFDLQQVRSTSVTWTLFVTSSLAEVDDGTRDVTIPYTITSTENASLSIEGAFTLQWQPQAATSGGPSTTGDGSQGSGSGMLLAAGLGVGLVVAALTMVLVRGRSGRNDGVDFTVDDLDDEYDLAPMPSAADASLDLDATSSLAALQSSGKELAELPPEASERPGAGLVAEADGHGSEDDAEADEGSGDGISVDEFGTEWYEDEIGVWWYREAGQDDWSEYHG